MDFGWGGVLADNGTYTYFFYKKPVYKKLGLERAKNTKKLRNF